MLCVIVVPELIVVNNGLYPQDQMASSEMCFKQGCDVCMLQHLQVVNTDILDRIHICKLDIDIVYNEIYLNEGNKWQIFIICALALYLENK